MARFVKIHSAGWDPSRTIEVNADAVLWIDALQPDYLTGRPRCELHMVGGETLFVRDSADSVGYSLNDPVRAS